MKAITAAVPRPYFFLQTIFPQIPRSSHLVFHFPVQRYGYCFPGLFLLVHPAICLGDHFTHCAGRLRIIVCSAQAQGQLIGPAAWLFTSFLRHPGCGLSEHPRFPSRHPQPGPQTHPANAGHYIRLAKGFFQGGGYLLQGQVALGVPMSIIDCLQVIYIAEE